MKNLFLLGLLVLPFFSFSQSFKSAMFSSNPGVYAIGAMPSLLVDRNSKWDVQLIGAQFNFFNSDNTGQTFSEKLKASLWSSNPKEILSVASTFAFIEGKISIPSISYAINENNVIAFSADLRSQTYENSAGFNMYEILNSIIENRSFDGELIDGGMTMYSNTWVQFGLSYARNWDINQDWSIQTGFTARYLSGVASGRLEFSGVQGTFSNSRTGNLSANVALVYNEQIDKIIDSGTSEIDLFSKNGYSLDFGFSAKWKDKLTIGIAVLDLGSIKYESAENSSEYSVTGESLDLESLNQVSTIDAFADSLKNQLTPEENPINDYKTKLPVTTAFLMRYTVSKRLSLNMSARIFKPQGGLELDGRKTLWGATFAPTFEIRKAALTVPIGYNNFSDFHTGLGLQWRFLNAGSDNLLSYYFSDKDTRAMSIYCSIRLKVGRYEKKK